MTLSEAPGILLRGVAGRMALHVGPQAACDLLSSAVFS